MSHMLQPSIILLREGTDTSQGKGQIISNVNACMAIVDTVRTTLGPRGMDKLMYQEGGSVTISNDGATIMKLLDIVHPAAQTLVEIAKSQDSEVGDGTTSVVLLAGELLKEGKPYIEEGMHSQVLIRGFRRACEMVREKLKELCVTVDATKKEELRNMLLKCAGTSMNSKLIRPYKDFFSRMVVDAIETLDDELALESIGIKKESGGSMQDSLFIKGVAFKKTFSYAGFEQQPKKFAAPKVLLLNVELELKAEKDNAEVRIHSVDKYQEMVDAEWKILFDKLDLIAKTGAKVVLSRLAIGDLATQFFADHDIFCAGRVPQDDLARVAKATGGQVQTSVADLIPTVLGTCGVFEERQVGAERYNFFTDCPQSKTATIILRGGGDHFNDEAERSIHDAIMVVRRARKHLSVVAGGGAIEMELSAWLRRESASVDGKQALIVKSFAKALEVIPRQLAINAGFDSTDIMNKLRQKHHTPGTGKWIGVDINSGDVCDTWEAAVWEPTLVKLNSITAATEAACTIFSVDETVRNPKSEAPDTGAMPAAAMRGRGGMRGMRGRGGRRF